MTAIWLQHAPAVREAPVTPGHHPASGAAAPSSRDGAASGSDGALPYLTRLLEAVLRAQGGDELLDVLDQLHTSARDIQHDAAAAGALKDAVTALPSHRALPIVRACSMHLAMANVADELRRLQLSRTADKHELATAGALMGAATRSSADGG